MRLGPEARRRLACWESDVSSEEDPARAFREATGIRAPTCVYRPESAARITNDRSRCQAPGIDRLVWQRVTDYDPGRELSGFAAPTSVIDGRQDVPAEPVPISTRRRGRGLSWMGRRMRSMPSSRSADQIPAAKISPQDGSAPWPVPLNSGGATRPLTSVETTPSMARSRAIPPAPSTRQ